MRRSIYGEDHSDFRQAARAYVTRELVPRLEEFRAARQIDRSVWITAGKQGLLGLDIPEQYGGSAAGDYRYNAILGEELARGSLALNSCFQVHFDIVVPYLVHLGSERQRERWLPPMAAGEAVSAIAMTEASGGSDLATLRSTAVRANGGWLLNGSKTFITNGFTADLVVVAARTSPGHGAKGITLFLVESDTPGFSRGRKLDKVGQPESNTAELFFDNVALPADSVLGEVDRGFAHMMQHLPRERISASVGNTAHARKALDDTLAYVKERVAFGRPVGSFQHNAFLLADLVTRLDVTQTFVDACVAAHADGELSSVDAAKAKLWSSEVQNAVIDACVQLHGGYGYMREYDVAQAWMDARVTRIWGGTNEIMKLIISRDLGLEPGS